VEPEGEPEELDLDDAELVTLVEEGVSCAGAARTTAIERPKTMPVEDCDVLEIEPCTIPGHRIPSALPLATTLVCGELPEELLALARRSVPPGPTPTLVGGQLPDELLGRARRSNPPSRPTRTKGSSRGK
jgi:hypothetical protein